MATTAPGYPTTDSRHFGAGRTLLIILGSLIALAGFAIAMGGAAALIANGVVPDRDGFFTSKHGQFTSHTAAITTRSLDVATAGPSDVLESSGFATVRIRSEGDAGKAVFVGIARAGDINRYLAGVAHDEITHINYDPFAVTSSTQAGGSRVAAPGVQTFWAATTAGRGAQTLRWTVQSGDWAVVAMNADGSPGVALRVDAGVKVKYVVAIGTGLLIGGFVLLGLGVIAIVLGARRGRGGGGSAALAGVSVGAATIAGATPATEGVPYPVQIEGHLDESRSRWRWLVKWFLAIPHYVVLVFLWLAFIVITVLAFFAIVFTGRYPRGMFDFNVGVIRWNWRVSFYTFGANGTDHYPPFSLGREPDYPATVDIPYPEHLSRGLVLVKWWLLAIPHYLVIAAFAGGIHMWGGGLIALLVLISAVYLLFTGRTLRDLWNLIIDMNRWVYRVVAYAALMRDEYPPFRLGR